MWWQGMTIPDTFIQSEKQWIISSSGIKGEVFKNRQMSSSGWFYLACHYVIVSVTWWNAWQEKQEGPTLREEKGNERRREAGREKSPQTEPDGGCRALFDLYSAWLMLHISFPRQGCDIMFRPLFSLFFTKFSAVVTHQTMKRLTIEIKNAGKRLAIFLNPPVLVNLLV